MAEQNAEAPSADPGELTFAEKAIEAASARMTEAATDYTNTIGKYLGFYTASKEAIPTRRAYYSDRTALLMALLCRYAYTAFENDDITERLLEVQLGNVGLTLKGWFATGGSEGYVATNDAIAVVAFRGTTNAVDWRTNLRATSPKTLLVKGRPPVCVHQGFFNAFEVVSEQVHRLLDDEVGKPIYVTGHSLGGAIAQIAAASLARDDIAACYTFGSPRVGDKSFDLYVKAPHYRVVNGYDCVPLVPFTFMRFHHGGDPRYIRVGDQEAARWNRSIARAVLVNFVALGALLTGKPFIGVKDHDIGLYARILYRIARTRGGWK